MSTNNLVSVYTKAHDWWIMKSESDRLELFNKYFPESKDTATIGHIAEIWDKETANTGKEKSQDELDGIDFFDIMQMYRMADTGRQHVVAERFENVKSFIRNLIEKKEAENKEMKELLQRIADYEVTGEGFKEKLLSVSNLAAMLLFKLNNK